MMMLAEYGTLSLTDVLAPAIEMADGYPDRGSDTREPHRARARRRSSSGRTRARVMLPHSRRGARGAVGGRDLPPAGPRRDAAQARRGGADRRSRRARIARTAILAAYDRFYRGDIAQEFVRGARERAASSRSRISRAGRCSSRSRCTQLQGDRGLQARRSGRRGRSMLQALNILENFDLKAMGYNSARYIHTVYQAMNLAFADRDFYYGDPYFPPEEPVRGLLSKDYARERAATRATASATIPRSGPAIPIRSRATAIRSPICSSAGTRTVAARTAQAQRRRSTQPSALGTTLDPGRGRRGLGGLGHAERRLDAGGHRGQHRHRPQPARAELRARRGARIPFNVIEPGKRPRVTLTPTLALKDGKPLPRLRGAGRRHAGPEPAAVLPQRRRVRDDRAGGDARRRTSTATRCAARFGEHESRARPHHARTSPCRRGCARELRSAWATRSTSRSATSGPINAIWFDREHGTHVGRLEPITARTTGSRGRRDPKPATRRGSRAPRNRT